MNQAPLQQGKFSCKFIEEKNLSKHIIEMNEAKQIVNYHMNIVALSGHTSYWEDYCKDEL